MARGFSLTARLVLQAPTNVGAVVSAINRQLRGITANINVNISAQTQKQLQNVSQSITRTTKQTQQFTNEIERFGHQSALAIRRFAAFSVATAGFIGLAGAIKRSFAEAIKFDREMVRVSQVTGLSLKNLTGLSDEITRLSTSLGVSSAKIANVSTILAQAGLTAQDTKIALEALAKTELSATFDDIQDTTEGAIAIMAQFGTSASDLEKQLSSINVVAAKFAVESSDIITAVRRTGGAFKASGGNLNELIALFTSVRATTRESAESIATGFRTIFTRVQRPATIKFLKELGIELRDLNGQFIGPYESVRRLSEALNQIESTDPRFAQIVEELGGFRQVSKVIPLIQQFATSEKALSIAQRGNNSLTQDAVTAQQALSVQIAKLREEFDALIRKVSQNAGIKAFIDFSLQLASALIKVTNAIEPLLPLIVGLGTLKLGSVLRSFGTGFSKAGQFARGGVVPGSGNTDSVPAMLTPGEFVVRKSAVKALGTERLHKMNKYAVGGNVKITRPFGFAYMEDKDNGGFYATRGNVADKTESGGAEARFVLENFERKFNNNQPVDKIFGDSSNLFKLNPNAHKTFNNQISKGLSGLVQNITNEFFPKEFSGTAPEFSKLFSTSLQNSVTGNIFEAVLRNSAGLTEKPGNTFFDFPQGLNRKFGNIFTGLENGFGFPTEVKYGKDGKLVAGVIRKALNAYGDSANLQKFAKGGSVGDTVPAMLTPGEFVVNRKAARKIGIGNLNRLNKAKGYAAGGPVGGGIGNFVSNRPFESLAIVSILTDVVGRLGGFGKEIESVTSILTSFGAQAAIFTTLLRNSPGFTGIQNRPADIQGQIDNIIKNRTRLEEAKRKAADVVKANIQTNPTLAARASIAANIKIPSRIQDLNKQISAQIALKDTAINTAKNFEKLSLGVGLASASLEVFGQKLTEIGTAELKTGDTASGINKRTAGGAAKGAGTGLLLGAAIAAATGVGIPAAIALLAGGTAVGGGVGGFFAKREATKESASIKFSKDIAEESRRLTLVSQGKNTPDILTGRSLALKSTKRFSEIAGDAESLSTFTSEVEQSLPSIEKFLTELAKGSNNFNTFNRQNNDLIRHFALFSKIPLAELQEQFKKQIEAQKRANSINIESIKLQVENNRRLQFLTSITKAFENLADKSSDLQRVFGDLISNVTTVADRSEIFGRVTSGTADLTNLSRTSGRIGSIFGVQGSNLSNRITGVAQTADILPQILSRIASQGLGTEGFDLGSSIKEALNKELAGTPIGIRNEIINSIRTQIDKETGASADPSKLIEEAIRAPQELSKKLLEGFTPLLEIFAKAEKSLSDNLNNIVSAYKSRSSLEKELLNQRLKTLELQGQENSTRLGFLGQTKNRAQIIAEQQARTGAISGGLNLPGVLGSIAVNRTQRAGLQQQLENPATEAERQQLTNKLAILNNEFDKLTNILEHYTDVQSRVSALEQRRSELESQRLQRRSLLTDVAIGGAKGLKTARTLGLAGAVSQDSTILSKLPPQIAEEVLNVLDQLASTNNKIGGKSAKDVRDEALRSLFKSRGATDAQAEALTKATGEEKQVQQDIITAYRDGIIASQALEKVNQDNITSQSELIKSLNQLHQTISQQAQNQANLAKTRDIAAVESEITSKRGLLGEINRLPNIIKANLGIAKNLQPELAKFKGIKEQEKKLETFDIDKVIASIPGGTLSADTAIKKILGQIRESNIFTGQEFFDITKELEGRKGETTKRISTLRGSSVTKTVETGTAQIPAVARLLNDVLGKALIEKRNELKSSEIDVRSSFPVGLTPEILEKNIGTIGRLDGSINELIKQIKSLEAQRALLGRATGGLIPGSGNRDSVPAMLTPGEFVLRKSAVNAIGLDNLHQMNGMATGGLVQKATKLAANIPNLPPSLQASPATIARIQKRAQQLTQGVSQRAQQNIAARQGRINTNIRNRANQVNTNISIQRQFRGLTPEQKRAFNADINANRLFISSGLPKNNNRGGFGFADRNFARKKALGFATSPNRRKFATGGLVTGNDGGVNIDTGSLNQFVNSAARLSNALDNFPRMIELSANHKVEVIFNGAEILTRLLPQIQEIAVSEASRAINNMIKSKIPDVGMM